jgi:hypothetical protein
MTASASADTLRLHRLTMVEERDGIMVGRPDIASYALFPPEGAEVLKMLAAGASIASAAAWYERTCGESLDLEDFVEALQDLGFVCGADEEYTEPSPVRWQRLGGWLFSWPAWAAYLVVVATALVLMARRPELRPSYRNLFFTHYLSLIPIALTATMIPCILLHEGFHALAGRRLGLPSKLSIGRRLYYLVAETRLDSLFSVPRRRRYLPFMAGMLADTVLISLLTVLAAVLQDRGVARWLPALCLAVAFSCVLRLIWQLMFYLETDLYFVLVHALSCTDLQNATRYYLRVRINRLLRRRPPTPPSVEWSDRDNRMARWYAPLLVIGYGFSLGSLLWAGLPTTVHFCSLLIERFRGTSATDGIIDALSFLTLSSLQWGLLAYVTIRDRRDRARANSR